MDENDKVFSMNCIYPCHLRLTKIHQTKSMLSDWRFAWTLEI